MADWNTHSVMVLCSFCSVERYASVKGLRRPGDWSLRDSGTVQYKAVYVSGWENYMLRSKISSDKFGEQILFIKLEDLEKTNL